MECKAVSFFVHTYPPLKQALSVRFTQPSFARNIDYLIILPCNVDCFLPILSNQTDYKIATSSRKEPRVALVSLVLHPVFHSVHGFFNVFVGAVRVVECKEILRKFKLFHFLNPSLVLVIRLCTFTSLSPLPYAGRICFALMYPQGGFGPKSKRLKSIMIMPNFLFVIFVPPAYLVQTSNVSQCNCLGLIYRTIHLPMYLFHTLECNIQISCIAHIHFFLGKYCSP
nr:MAG TPA: hypothetical protein [Caudoviricetes sp.]